MYLKNFLDILKTVYRKHVNAFAEFLCLSILEAQRSHTYFLNRAVQKLLFIALKEAKEKGRISKLSAHAELLKAIIQI